MTYSCCDFTDDIFAALGLNLPDDVNEDGDNVSLMADLALAKIAHMQARQLPDRDSAIADIARLSRKDKATAALNFLVLARNLYTEIGARNTRTKLCAILSSARGAVRAAGYRDAREEEKRVRERAAAARMGEPIAIEVSR